MEESLGRVRFLLVELMQPKEPKSVSYRDTKAIFLEMAEIVSKMHQSLEQMKSKLPEQEIQLDETRLDEVERELELDGERLEKLEKEMQQLLNRCRARYTTMKTAKDQLKSIFVEIGTVGAVTLEEIKSQLPKSE